jgi:Glycosyl-hydrolase 97 N-terminal
VLELPQGPKLGALQADLDRYPALYLTQRASHPRSLSSAFPRRVVREQPGGWMSFDLVGPELAADIAETSGTRCFPWRALVVAECDIDLVGSDIVTRLAAPVAPDADFSWVEPGLVGYWANWNIEGVGSITGRNTTTFKHYVDFAAKDARVLRRGAPLLFCGSQDRSRSTARQQRQSQLAARRDAGPSVLIAKREGRSSSLPLAPAQPGSPSHARKTSRASPEASATAPTQVRVGSVPCRALR